MCGWNPFRVTLAFKKKQKRFSVPSPHLLILCRHSSSSIRRRERPNNKTLNGGRGEGSDRMREGEGERGHLLLIDLTCAPPFGQRRSWRMRSLFSQNLFIPANLFVNSGRPLYVLPLFSRGPPTRSLDLGLHFTVLEERNTR